MKRTLFLFALLVALLVALSPLTRAQTLVLSPGSNPSSAGQIFSGTVGELFTVNPGYVVTVTGIGFWDYGTAGVDGSDTVSVAIFNSLGSVVSGTLINTTNSGTSGAAFSASGYMGATYSPSTNPGTGQFFVYTLTTPVVLSAGDYAIAGWGYNNVANYEINAGGGNALANFDPISGALTLSGSSFANTSATLPLVGNVTANASIMAATFVATAIPEPATYAELLGVIAFAVVTFRLLMRRRDLTS